MVGFIEPVGTSFQSAIAERTAVKMIIVMNSGLFSRQTFLHRSRPLHSFTADLTAFLRFRSSGPSNWTELLIVNYLSFSDKKSLTNAINWSILCAMNTTKSTPKLNNAGLIRIKIFSRIAMLLVIGFLLSTLWFLLRVWFLHGTPLLFDKFNASSARTSHQYPLFLCSGILSLITPLILCIWYWKLAQLFHFFERGLILAVKTIRCIKFLGVLCMINGLLINTLHVLLQDQPPQRMDFFSFSFGWGIDFGPLVAGTIIVLVAWIMDEGRKMQEEQELTV
jgi:hypothetical protein